MRPARYASRPASMAAFMATAIASGSAACAMPGVQEHAVDAQLHGDRHVAGRAHAGIDDHRIVGIAVLEILQANADVVGVEDALAGSDRAARRHHARRAGLFQPPGDDRIVARIAEDLKTFGHQPLGGLERGHGVGQQRLRIPQHLQLDPVGARVFQPQQDLAAEPCDAHGVVGRKTPGRVRQQRVAAAVDVIEDVLPTRVDEPLAAHGHGNAVGSRAGQRVGHQFVAGILAGADDQPAGQRMGSHLQSIAQLQFRSQTFTLPPRASRLPGGRPPPGGARRARRAAPTAN